MELNYCLRYFVLRNCTVQYPQLKSLIPSSTIFYYSVFLYPKHRVVMLSPQNKNMFIKAIKSLMTAATRILHRFTVHKSRPRIDGPKWNQAFEQIYGGETIHVALLELLPLQDKVGHGEDGSVNVIRILWWKTDIFRGFWKESAIWPKRLPLIQVVPLIHEALAVGRLGTSVKKHERAWDPLVPKGGWLLSLAFLCVLKHSLFFWRTIRDTYKHYPDRKLNRESVRCRVWAQAYLFLTHLSYSLSISLRPHIQCPAFVQILRRFMEASRGSIFFLSTSDLLLEKAAATRTGIHGGW